MQVKTYSPEQAELTTPTESSHLNTKTHLETNTPNPDVPDSILKRGVVLPEGVRANQYLSNRYLF